MNKCMATHFGGCISSETKIITLKLSVGEKVT